VTVLITGEGPGLLEVEVQDGAGAVRFAQNTMGGTTFAAILVDDEPRLVSAHGPASSGAALFLAAPPAQLPHVDGALPVSEALVAAATPLLDQLADGLYVLESAPSALVPPKAGLATSGAYELPGASPLGVPVDLALPGVSLRVSGADARVAAALTIRADVIVERAGFTALEHDHGAREAFARSPGVALDLRVLRDAIARHGARYETVDLGPFSLAVLEPAREQARALVFDLRLEDAVEMAAEPIRVAGPVTEHVAWVRALTIPFEVAFLTRDGLRIDEVAIRTFGRLRASGVRPAARAIAKVLRALADEGV
jgi:hypothetical protein